MTFATPPSPTLGSIRLSVNSGYIKTLDFKEFQWFWNTVDTGPGIDPDTFMQRTTTHHIVIPLENSVTSQIFSWVRAVDRSGNFNSNGWVASGSIDLTEVLLDNTIKVIDAMIFRI
jgi:hypothetical protein